MIKIFNAKQARWSNLFMLNWPGVQNLDASQATLSKFESLTGQMVKYLDAKQAN